MDMNPQMALFMRLLQQGQAAPPPDPDAAPDFGMTPPSSLTYSAPSTPAPAAPAAPSLIAPADTAPPQDAPPSLVAPPPAAPAVAEPVYGKTFADDSFSKRQKTMLMLSALQDIGSTMRGEQGGEFDKAYTGYNAANKDAYGQQMALAERQRRIQIAAGHPEWGDVEQNAYAYAPADKAQELGLGNMKSYEATPGAPHINPLNPRDNLTPPIYSTAGSVATVNGPAGLRAQALPPSYSDVTARGAAIATAQEARARVAQGDWYNVGATPDGHPVYQDRHTGGTHVGTEFVDPKNASVFELKMNALKQFMSSEEAARWAAGQRPMSEAEIADHAEQRATARIQAGEGMGDPLAHDKFRQEAIDGLRAANNLSGGGAPGGGAVPPPSPHAPPTIAAPGQKNFVMPPPAFAGQITSKAPGVPTHFANGHVYTTNQAGQIVQIR